MKVCTKCGVSKSLEEFARDRRSKDGRRPSCKTCMNRAGLREGWRGPSVRLPSRMGRSL